MASSSRPPRSRRPSVARRNDLRRRRARAAGLLLTAILVGIGLAALVLRGEDGGAVAGGGAADRGRD
ncbi:MAG: hypothetical protein JWN65_3883, partial [Solirubrobacterales bacterium]|nr:hypothetical protein [Solirubrobacterales bacterium]